MAGFVPNEYRSVLMEAIVGKTTITLGTTYLGLAKALPADPMTSTLLLITEVTTAGYARRTTGTWPASSVVAPIQIVQTTGFAFLALTADMAEPAYFAFLTSAATGTASPIRYIWELPTPVQGRNGEALTIPASALILE